LDFQCSVCGAIFTTDEDRKQHLEKEAHGILHEGTIKKDKEIAKIQDEENETYSHCIWLGIIYPWLLAVAINIIWHNLSSDW